MRYAVTTTENGQTTAVVAMDIDFLGQKSLKSEVLVTLAVGDETCGSSLHIPLPVLTQLMETAMLKHDAVSNDIVLPGLTDVAGRKLS